MKHSIQPKGKQLMTYDPIIKRGDRIIRVGGNLICIKKGAKVIAGTISENGRLVVVNGMNMSTMFFKRLIRCNVQG